MDSSPARDEILRRIRSSLRDVPADETPESVAVARDYLRAASPSFREGEALAEPRGPIAHGGSAGASPSPQPTSILDQFIERVTEYRAVVRRVTSAELAGAIASACAARGARRLVAPADLPADWVPGGIELLRDPGLTNEQLDSADGVLTGCALAIAQTGTIVLDGGPAQGRRALTLLPDYHLCVVRADQVVGLVPEAVARLHESAREPGRPMTWISGPSATSDIELNRVEGVHGPRTLEVLVVAEPGPIP